MAAARADELRRELDRAAGELAELSAANDNLSAQLQAYDEDRIRLRSELEAARLDWEDEKAALELHQQSGVQVLADQQALAQALSTRLETLEAERASLQGELTAERQQWEADRAALAREAADAVARANELQAGLERRDRESEAALAEARVLQQGLQNRLDALEAERAGLINSVDSERRSWHEERAALVSAVAEAQGRAADIERALQDQHGSVAHELTTARGYQQELEARLAALDAERSQWTARFDHERETWQHERQALESAVNGAQARVADLEAALRAHHDTQAHLLEQARAHHHELQLRLDALEHEHADMAARFESEKGLWQEDLLTLTAALSQAEVRAADLESSLALERDTHVSQLAESCARQHDLQTRLQAFDQERADWGARLETEQHAWHEERIALAAAAATAAAAVTTLEASIQERDSAHAQILEAVRARWDAERAELLAEASARSEEFQAALEVREQVHAEAIAREQVKFEELIAELMQAANDQQAEYQQLMAERTAAFEQQVSRVERVHAELARVRGESEQQRAALEAHCRQLEARAAAAEAMSVAHETRHREVCREAERLVALLAPAPAAAVVDQQTTLFTGTVEAAQAVA